MLLLQGDALLQSSPEISKDIFVRKCATCQFAASQCANIGQHRRWLDPGRGRRTTITLFYAVERLHVAVLPIYIF